MLNIKKMEDSQNIGVVYDISLDGTVVNALGMNVISNTDGWMVLTSKNQMNSDILSIILMLDWVLAET